MILEERMRDRRKELDLTLADIAKAVGVSEATVQRWESGKIKNLRYERIPALAVALHTTPAYLMGWEDIPEETTSSKAMLKAVVDGMNKPLCFWRLGKQQKCQSDFLYRHSIYDFL